MTRTGYIGTSAGFDYEVIARTAAGRDASAQVQANAAYEDRVWPSWLWPANDWAVPY